MASRLGKPSSMRYYICSWRFCLGAYKEPPHKSAGVTQIEAIMGWSFWVIRMLLVLMPMSWTCQLP